MPVLNAALQLSSTHTYTQPMFNHARKNHSTNNHTTKMLFKRSGVSYTLTTHLKKCKLIKNKIKNQQYLTSSTEFIPWVYYHCLSILHLFVHYLGYANISYVKGGPYFIKCVLHFTLTFKLNFVMFTPMTKICVQHWEDAFL